MASPLFQQPPDLAARFREAIQFYWDTRTSQQARQQEAGMVADAGLRSAVTGGAQMARLESLIAEILIEAGFMRDTIRTRVSLELPGFYRPEKKWDLVVVADNQLLAAMEFKSQAGPSFGNNFNNRTEEAIGSATCLWTAFREGRLGTMPGFKPLLGYFFLLEDCPKVHRPVGVEEPHFTSIPFSAVHPTRSGMRYCAND